MRDRSTKCMKIWNIAWLQISIDVLQMSSPHSPTHTNLERRSWFGLNTQRNRTPSNSKALWMNGLARSYIQANGLGKWNPRSYQLRGDRLRGLTGLSGLPTTGPYSVSWRLQAFACWIKQCHFGQSRPLSSAYGHTLLQRWSPWVRIATLQAAQTCLVSSVGCVAMFCFPILLRTLQQQQYLLLCSGRIFLLKKVTDLHAILSYIGNFQERATRCLLLIALAPEQHHTSGEFTILNGKTVQWDKTPEKWQGKLFGRQSLGYHNGIGTGLMYDAYLDMLACSFV